MNLSNMTPKDRQLYEIAMERKNNMMHSLRHECMPYDLSEIIYHISRAEYKRGKADGVAESIKNANHSHQARSNSVQGGEVGSSVNAKTEIHRLRHPSPDDNSSSVQEAS